MKGNLIILKFLESRIGGNHAKSQAKNVFDMTAAYL